MEVASSGNRLGLLATYLNLEFQITFLATILYELAMPVAITTDPDSPS